MKLTIALQEGFDRDGVVVRLDGAEVFRKAAVTTRLQLGLADSVEVEVPDHAVIIDVAIPAKRVTGSHTVRPSATPHVGIDLTEDGLHFVSQAEPFGYM